MQMATAVENVVFRGLHKFLRQSNCKLFTSTESRRCLNGNSENSHHIKEAGFGLLFDIDGVLCRGHQVLPEATSAFNKLRDRHGKLRVPVVFVTNAGNCLRQTKAEQLSEMLNFKVTPDQVVMSHSPLKMCRHLHDKHILVSGQGPVKDIAKGLGFHKITTVDELRDMYPHLDSVDHSRRTILKKMTNGEKPKIDHPQIEAVVLFGEPIRWETSLQLVIDTVLTNGCLYSRPTEVPKTHLPVIACNVDLLWMAEAHLPRIGHGSFLLCLEALYQKITGHKLRYTVLTGKPSEITYHYAETVLIQQARKMGIQSPIRTLYAIGDNPATDIYGANLYNEYLGSKLLQQMSQAKSVAIGGNSSNFLDSSEVVIENMEHNCAEVMESVLVCTGVYSKTTSLEVLEKDPVDHGHRDFHFVPKLATPSIEVPCVHLAIKEIFKRENFD
ncbi:haloacid dehalogenase-like hydrolase domain-containing 5 [Anneissia japonica]|uniref:haloacid dehalogenase-like hydrolase domain-containing 5 n=1 Tax=Anneissia japonica TaxID=1529436 RepID=UPI0014254F61|nr:haloacid dehalogenase-like hydrolase domain-containing 5 [Anneissia japonica]